MNFEIHGRKANQSKFMLVNTNSNLNETRTAQSVHHGTNAGSSVVLDFLEGADDIYVRKKAVVSNAAGGGEGEEYHSPSGRKKE